MLKLKFWLSLVVLLAALFFISNAFIGKTQRISRVLVLKTDPSAIRRILFKEENLSSWCAVNNMELKNRCISHKSFLFCFNQNGSTIFPVSISKKRGSVNSYFQLVAISENKSEITWSASLTSAGWLDNLFNYFRAVKTSKVMDDLLRRLQAFAENKKDSLYPIAIAIKKQTEPSVAVINKTVTTNILFTEISKSYHLLKNELLSNGNFMEDSIMLYIKEPVDNTTSYMIGMPAKKPRTAGNNISYMIMPPNGNMLVANFTGLYKERKKVYRIIEEYISDKSISKASLAYEKMDGQKIPASFDDQVTVNVCFPVY